MPKRLLVIEDDPALLELMLDFCEEMGLGAIPAETGAEGLAKAARERPDIITVDHRLPDQLGLDVIQRLKSDPATQQIPVIFLSADARQHEAEAMKRGAAGVLTKPVAPGALRAMLEKCIGPW